MPKAKGKVPARYRNEGVGRNPIPQKAPKLPKFFAGLLASEKPAPVPLTLRKSVRNALEKDAAKAVEPKPPTLPLSAPAKPPEPAPPPRKTFERRTDIVRIYIDPGATVTESQSFTATMRARSFVVGIPSHQLRNTMVEATLAYERLAAILAMFGRLAVLEKKVLPVEIPPVPLENPRKIKRSLLGVAVKDVKLEARVVRTPSKDTEQTTLKLISKKIRGGGRR